MRKTRKRAFASAAIASLAVLAAGCSSGGPGEDSANPGSTTTEGSTTSSGGGEKTEITFGYAAGGEIENYMNQIIAYAEQKLPDVTITPVVYATYDDQLNQLPTQFAAGTAPDIIQWDTSAPVGQYASEGAIVPFGQALDSTSYDASAYPKALVDGWTIDGQLYGIPLYLQNSAMVFNMDVLAKAGITEPPTSIDAVGDAARAIHAADPNVSGLTILNNLFHISQYLYAFGGGYDHGKTIDSPENEQALQWLVDLFADGSMATAQALGATWDGEAIAANKAGMSDGGPWYVGFMSSTAPTVNYQMLPIPTTTSSDPFVTTYGAAFSITSAAKNVDLASQVIGYLADQTSQEAILSTNLGNVPAMTSVADQFRDATPAYAAFTADVLSNGRTLDYPAQEMEFGNDLVAGFEKMIADPASASPADLLKSLQDKYGTN